jgi:hypothetical protein
MNKHSKSPTMRPHLWGLIVAVTAALVCALAGPAYAEFGDGFGVSTFDGAVTTSTGAPYTQAGGHPFQMSTTIDFNRLPPGTSGGEYETVNGETLPDGQGSSAIRRRRRRVPSRCSRKPSARRRLRWGWCA